MFSKSIAYVELLFFHLSLLNTLAFSWNLLRMSHDTSAFWKPVLKPTSYPDFFTATCNNKKTIQTSTVARKGRKTTVKTAPLLWKKLHQQIVYT